MSRAARVLVGLTLVSASAAAVDEGADAPEQPVPPSLEVFAFAGPSLVAGEPAVPDATESFRRVGIYGQLGVAFRSRYFLDPFLALGYGTLASADTDLPDGAWGEGGTLSQRLDTWLVSPGVTADLYRFRLRLDICVSARPWRHRRVDWLPLRPCRRRRHALLAVLPVGVAGGTESSELIEQAFFQWPAGRLQPDCIL